MGAAADPDRRPRGRDGPSVTAFRPAGPLTPGRARAGADRVHGRVAHHRPAGRRVRMLELDRALVRAAGLLGSARHVLAEARAAGLAPPARFGSEVVARLLGLRYNHPSNRDGLELLRAIPPPAPRPPTPSRNSSSSAPGRRPRPSTRRRLRPAGAHRLAAADPHPHRLLRRFPVRLGRDLGADTDALRRHLAWRLRLLRLRLEDLPARVLFGRAAAPERAARAHGLRDGRRGARLGASDGGAPSARRPRLLLGARHRGRPATSRTWASTRAAAGSFTRRAKGRR